MSAPTVLFLGHHLPLLQMLRKQVGGKFKVEQLAQSSSFERQCLQDVSMIVLQHDPALQDVLPDVRQFRRDVPDIPVIIFTPDFSGINTRAFLKSGAADVFPLNTCNEDVLACYEAYLPGFKFAPPKGKLVRNGKSSTLLMATAATGLIAASPAFSALSPSERLPAAYPIEQPESYVGGLALKFLGFFSTTINGRRIEFTKQAKLIFAYLAYNHPRAFSRDHLARVFWPDKHENQPESARRSLNVELATIRKALRAQLGQGQDIIVFEKNHYRLAFNFEVRSDVYDFKQLCQQVQDLRRAGKSISDDIFQAVIQAYHGEFLEDCPLETMNWVEVERQHLSAVFEQMAEQYSAQLFQEGDYWKATAVCHEILAHDPNIEVIHRRLMLCYAQLGMCNKMEAQYKLLCHILKAKFQAKPSLETQRVYEQIKQEIC
jgi:DNA-binding SARP family transcriptional activator